MIGGTFLCTALSNILSYAKNLSLHFDATDNNNHQHGLPLFETHQKALEGQLYKHKIFRVNPILIKLLQEWNVDS